MDFESKIANWNISYCTFYQRLLRHPASLQQFQLEERHLIHLPSLSYHTQLNIFNFFLNCLPNERHKITFGMSEILSFPFLTMFCQKCQIPHSTLWRNIKYPQLSGNRAILQLKVVNSGKISISVYLWPCSVQGHLGPIRCTCDISKNTISKTLHLL